MAENPPRTQKTKPAAEQNIVLRVRDLHTYFLHRYRSLEGAERRFL